MTNKCLFFNLDSKSFDLKTPKKRVRPWKFHNQSRKLGPAFGINRRETDNHNSLRLNFLKKKITYNISGQLGSNLVIQNSSLLPSAGDKTAEASTVAIQFLTTRW